MDFPNGPASYFSLLVSNDTPIYLDAYDANNNLLETAGPAPVDYNTGHMTELAITRATADIAYVIVHDSGNYFLVDAICTNASAVIQTQVFRLPWAGGNWNYTNGPHGTSYDGPNALDFQPLPANIPPGGTDCSSPTGVKVDTNDWVYPVAPGTVKSVVYPAKDGGNNDVGANPSVPVSLFIDNGDGNTSYYTHLANTTVNVGAHVDYTTPLGNPSCFIEQGGSATGIHVHFALQNASNPNVMFQTQFCGWLLSENSSDVNDSPLVRNGTAVYPIGEVNSDNCPTPGAADRTLDTTQHMNTGDSSNGSFNVDYLAGGSQSLNVVVGPFASDVGLALTRPDGSQVAPTDPGVQYVKTTTSVSYTIANPSAGQWTYTITANQLMSGGENIRIVADENNGITSPVDVTPPATTAAVSPSPNTNGWDNAAVAVALSATDDSGVATTYYALDDATCTLGSLGSCSIYTNPYSVTANGKHTIYFFSVDNAGNYELQQSIPINIDETPPQTTASLSGTLAGGNQYLAPVTVTLTASDNLSGVSSTMYQVDGGAAQTYGSPFAIVAAGTHQVTYYSVDNAGNTEATHTTSVTIVTLPTSTPTPVPPTSIPSSTPTNTPLPMPTSTPQPTNTPQPPAPATNTPQPALPTSTPVPPAPTIAPPTSTRPALATAVPPIPAATPTPRTAGLIPFTLNLSPRRIVSGKVLTVRVDTLPKAPVSLTLQVVTKKTVVTGKGTHRKRVTRTTVLYRLRQHGVAGAKGHFVARLHVVYNPHTATRASLIATARISHSPATRTTTVTIQPAPHHKKRR